MRKDPLDTGVVIMMKKSPLTLSLQQNTSHLQSNMRAGPLLKQNFLHMVHKTIIVSSLLY